MFVRTWPVRIAVWSVGCFVLMATMGGSCSFGLPDIFGDVFFDDTITIELVNTAGYPVDPALYVGEDEDVSDEADLIRDENFVDISPPVDSGEIVTLEFECDEVGSMVCDFPWLLISDTEFVESVNSPILEQGQGHFGCGDIVSFIFIDEEGGDFFTRIEVNGVFLTD